MSGSLLIIKQVCADDITIQRIPKISELKYNTKNLSEKHDQFYFPHTLEVLQRDALHNGILFLHLLHILVLKLPVLPSLS